MYKKQRNALIAYILFYGGFFLLFVSIIIILIYTIGFKNHDVSIVHILLIIFAFGGIIMVQCASMFNLIYYFPYRSGKPMHKIYRRLRMKSDNGFIQGVPNNKLSDFYCLNFDESNTLVLYEKSGIYEGDYKSKHIIVDMQKWILKDMYVYELFHTIYRIKYLKKHKINRKFMYKKIIDDNVNEFILIIKKKNKEKKYYLSYNGMIKSSKILRIRNKLKNTFLEDNKVSINDYYNFNE